MEHIHPAHPGNLTLEVFRRFVKRKLHGSVGKVAGGTAIALAITGATLMLPSPAHLASRVDTAAAQPVSSTGVVTSLIRKAVGTPFSGEVRTMLARPGERVHKGQLLFLMDTHDLQAQLAGAQLELSSARQAYTEAASEKQRDLAPILGQIGQLKSSLAQLSAPVPAVLNPVPGNMANPNGDGAIAGQDNPDGRPQVVMFRPQPDPVAQQDLQARIAVAEHQLQEKRRSWAESLHEMGERTTEATQRVRHLEAMIAGARRVSPMDGVVSSVTAREGDDVTAKVPVVQIDDPSTYRVLVSVDERAASSVSPGASLSIENSGATTAARLEKVARGWDKDLFTYYLWLKPSRMDGLHEGEHVTVQLPPQTTQQAAR
jgi:multidrug efflux pump subunit AcrA (membrane-fusion protein)